MELPTIKLNIFKKLDYFLILKELNSQFDSQLNILKSKEFDFESKKFINSAYPVWEIEKKVLFWTYSYHKFINQKIKASHFKDMFISENESRYVGGQYNIFGNLKTRGFGNTSGDGLECAISKEGLAFGELLWYLYEPKPIERTNDNKKKPESYQNIYDSKHILSKNIWGWWILQLQLFSIYLLTVYVVALFTLEIIEKIKLIDNLQKLASNVPIVSSDIFWIIVASIPFITFMMSFIADYLYKWFVVKNKYKHVEELKN